VAARSATPLLAVAMMVAARAVDSPVLYVPGIGLLLASVAAWVWVWLAARETRLEHGPAPRTVVEDEPYPLKLFIRRGLIPLPIASVTHPLAPHPVPVDPRADSPIELEIASAGRGWHRIEPATLVIRDPLGLARTRVRASDPPRVLVLPRIEDLIRLLPGTNGGDGRVASGGHGAEANSGRRAVDFEVDGLRAYRPGTPASRIHWPILARTGELTERRLVGGGATSPIVVLDARRPRDASALDRAVRAAASLSFHLAPAAGCLLVLPGERAPLRIDPDLRAWPRAHARLALAGPSASQADGRIASRSGTLFWVSASGSIPRLPHALSGGSSYLVTAAPIRLGVPAFEVAGCEAHQLAAAQDSARKRAV
jgi:uncharacterized protein (DUF58 family)